MSPSYARSIPATDTFSTPRQTLESLITQLQSKVMMSAPHGELESFVREQGRELERQLLQAHPTLSAERRCEKFHESEAGQPGAR